MPGVPDSVRAQLLATEHWSLLASRSTTQAEVLTRISIFLTLVSASLVSLALIGQATDFGGGFALAVVIVLGVVALVGVLTELRVAAVGMEDLMYVLAMNRLRAAYLDLDPSLAPWFLASAHDDRAGSIRTYYFFGGKREFVHVAGSSMVLIMFVVSALLGLSSAAVVVALQGPVGVTVVVGLAVGLAHLVVALLLGNRMYLSAWRHYSPVAPTPGGSTA